MDDARSADQEPHQSPEVGRRRFLRAAVVGAGAGAVFLDPVSLAFAEPRPGAEDADAGTTPADAETTVVVDGRIEPGAPDWVYLPVRIPSGASELSVRYSYDRPEPPAGLPGNALDIGVFDVRGHDLGDAAGFRGWSGGARDSFTISRSEATPGYVPGPVTRGTWHLVLGPYTVHPQGLNYRIEVTVRRGRPGPAFVPRTAPAEVPGRGPGWYRGDLHAHTVHSDGSWTPPQLLAAARAAGLDFLGSSEHNTHTASGVWGRHVPDDLLLIDGEEVTTRNGHFLATGLPPGAWIDWRYRAADDVVDRFVAQIHRYGALAIAAHPFCPYVGCSWKFGFDGFDAVEVWNGPWTPDDEAALYQWDATLVEHAVDGRWRPAVGNSDSHRPEQTVGLPQTVVRADRLDRGAILAAVAAGHSYLAESAAVSLDFAASADGRRAGPGERLGVARDAEVTVTLDVSGAGEGTSVVWVTDQGGVATLPVPAAGDGRVTWRTSPQVSAYVRAEVRRAAQVPGLPGPMVALTNPVFLGSL